jgi:hypothetical protein
MFPPSLKLTATLKYALPLLALAFVVSKVTHYLVIKDVPPFLAEMEERLPTNPYIVTRLGENARFEDTYNENELLKDTLNYTFSLHGSKGTIHIKGAATKKQGNWVPIKSDTTFAP